MLKSLYDFNRISKRKCENMPKIINRLSLKDEIERIKNTLEQVLCVALENKVSVHYLKEEFQKYPKEFSNEVTVLFYDDMVKNKIELVIKYTLVKVNEDFKISISLIDVIYSIYKSYGKGRILKRLKKAKKTIRKLNKMKRQEIQTIEEISKTFLHEDYYIYNITNSINEKIRFDLNQIKK